MGKIIEIRDLFNDTLNEIAKNENTWLNFLITASWNFKYNFNDQILIYAQNPNATACAEMQEWNKKVKRWVNKGANCIFVFSKDERNKYPFRIVFDVSDTHNYKNTPYKLWNIRKEYEEKIIESLETRFGEIENNSDLIQAIFLTSNNIVLDSIQDYISQILKYKEESELKNLSDDEIRGLIYQTIFSSISFIVLNRCGINPNEYITKNEFSCINKFKNTNIITLLGTAISDIAEMELREIAKTVINLEKEKNTNRTFDNQEKINYNDDNKNKGGFENDENRIYENRRLQHSKFSNETGKIADRKIRTNEVELLKDREKGRIHSNVNEQQVINAFEGNTRTGNENDKSNSKENGGTIWDNRKFERERSVILGTDEEQLQVNGRGTSYEGDNIQLSLLTEIEQKEIITEAENASVFSFTQEMIDCVLQEGSHFSEDKFRIYEHFNKSLSSKENADFLKNEYGIGGRSADINGVSEEHNSKGIILRLGYNDNSPILKLSWMQVEKRIRELISIDRYFNEKEKEEYFNWIDNNKSQIDFHREDKIYDEKYKFDNKYQYTEGQIVYLEDEKKFKISKIDIENNSIQLLDLQLANFIPIFREETIDNFERLYYNNPLNEEEKTNKDIIENNNIHNKSEGKKLTSNIKKDRRNKIEYFDLYPEVPLEDRNNYKITNNLIGEGTKKEKYQKNIDAIKVLKKCEEEKRYATKEEQEILAQYVGWGGISEVFDSNNEEWKKEYNELFSILTEIEYKEAKESTLTSFYTPPIVIDAIYKALNKMGLNKGNILEPSCRSR